MHLLQLARQAILTPANIQDSDIEKLMNHLLSAEVDAADIYFQSSHSESWVLESGIVKEGHHSIEQGAGVRAVSGEKQVLPTVIVWKSPFCLMLLTT